MPDGSSEAPSIRAAGAAIEAGCIPADWRLGTSFHPLIRLVDAIQAVQTDPARTALADVFEAIDILSDHPQGPCAIEGSTREERRDWLMSRAAAMSTAWLACRRFTPWNGADIECLVEGLIGNEIRLCIARNGMLVAQDGAAWPASSGLQIRETNLFIAAISTS